jgi:hypothetical protein
MPLDALRTIIDQLSYNLLYAPDYPPLDKTSLALQRDELLRAIRDVESNVKREDIGDWIRLALTSVQEVFTCFEQNRDGEARKEIQIAQSYLENAISKKQHRATFIASPGGSIARS